MAEGYVHSTETFGAADGPGVRYIIFMAGCHFRCKYCHNPDTWAGKGEKTTSEEMFKKAIRYKTYWKKGGGITVSGGEPLLQIDFLIDLFKMAKEQNISTCIDTAGEPFTFDDPFFTKFEELMKYTDLLLLDIKEIDPERHKRITGFKNDNVLKMAKYLSDINKPVWIRHVLVPTLSDFDEDLIKLRKFLDTLNNVERIDVLPYHTLGVFKWKELGIKYDIEDVCPPSDERVKNAKKILGCY